jgi:hypothetical protein
VSHHALTNLTILLDDGPGPTGSTFVPALALSDTIVGPHTIIENQVETSPFLGASDAEEVLINGTVRNNGTIAENPGALIGNELDISIASNASLVNSRTGVISGTTISTLRIAAGSGSLLVNDGMISGQGTTLDVEPQVTGKGVFAMSPGANPGSHTGIPSLLAFHQTVGAGVTVELNDTMLVLDSPMTFGATIDDLSVTPASAFATNSSIILNGEHATDLLFKNNVLTVLSGADTLAMLRFAPGLSADDFGLTNTAQGGRIGIVAPSGASNPIAPVQTPVVSLPDQGGSF